MSEELLKGIDILRKYGDYTAAEHDEFYFHLDKRVSKKDAIKLKKLDWIEEEENSWMHFT